MGQTELREFWRTHPQTAIAFSGGVDSAALLVSAIEAEAQVQAYFVKSEFQPDFEQTDAERVASRLNVPLTILRLSVLNNPAITANGPDRCYHCKKRILQTIQQRARADGYTHIADGTNADDDPTDRPGTRALNETGILSPLRLCGISKTEARSIAKRAGLSNWNKPAYACLATRFPTGTPLTLDELSRIERAEGILTELGFTDFRVRRLPNGAKLELRENELTRAVSQHERIVTELKPLLGTVLLDLTPRRTEPLSGSTPVPPEQLCELRCNVDDITGEEAAYAIERLMEAGALDAWTQAITMKKGRPALQISCLCRLESEPELTALLFRHTTTLGVRRSLCERSFLSRRTEHRGPARVKVSEGEGVRREKTEFEDLAALARQEGISLWEVREKYGL